MPLSRRTNMGLELRRHIVTVQRKASDNVRAFARGWLSHPKKKQYSRRDGTRRLAEEDPPGAEHGTCKDKNSPYDNNDHKRLSYRSIESIEGGSSPIHPSIASPASFDTNFPAANHLPVPFAENPNPEVDIRI